MSLKFWTAARNTMRPMRPKPLMPILMVMGKSSAKNSSAERRPHRRHHVLRREAEVPEQHRPRRRLAVAVDADDGGAAVLPPAVGHAHLDRDARHAGGQERLLVGAVLAIEHR